jgi:hypothetical protein
MRANIDATAKHDNIVLLKTIYKINTIKKKIIKDNIRDLVSIFFFRLLKREIFLLWKKIKEEFC